MSEPKTIVAQHDTNHGTARSYIVGFILSLILTFGAYVLTVEDILSGWTLVYVLAALAVTQLTVQLVCFLHLGRESKPRWNLTAAAFALTVVVILVFGSLWIMQNLSYNHGHHGLTSGQTDEFIKSDEGYDR